ncbi:MAG: hypothetical protein AAF298_09445, partial [Cyanobacteria bacterium P01_A01_bin.40]
LLSDASSKELRKQHQKFQALVQQLNNNRFEMMLQTKEVLTHKQLTQLTVFMQQKVNQQTKL